MKRIHKILIFLACLLTLTGPAQAYYFYSPALWTLSDEDTTIYIFGTIHLMDKDTVWQSAALYEAFDSAEELILELAPDQLAKAGDQILIARHGVFRDGTRLPEVLEEETYKNVQTRLKDLGLSGNSMDPFLPWLVATLLTVQASINAGFLPDYGVDRALMKRAEEEGKPALGLETAEYQLSAFSSQTLETQAIYLDLTLQDLENFEPLFVEVRDAWLHGDLESLEILLNEGWEFTPDLKTAILDQRNKNWVEKLKEMMGQKGTFFMAVGTGHLVGPGNVIELLEKEGFTVSVK